MKITKKKNKTTITLSRQYLEFMAVRLHNTAYNKSSQYTFSHTTIGGTTTLEFIITDDPAPLADQNTVTKELNTIINKLK